MYQGSNAWRQVRVLFVSLASDNVLSSKSTQREVISLSRRSASGEGVSTCRVSNCGMRRSSYHQHMISPQAAPMRCARRDVVATWNVDVCQNTACRDEKCRPPSPTHPPKMDAPYSQKGEEKAINYQLLTINY